jgi:hypothetical protein
MAIIAGHVEVKRFHLHIGGQTSLEGLIQVTHKPGCWKVSARPSARLPLKSNLSVVPTGRPKALGRPRSLQCNKTAWFISSLSQTAKLWCVDSRENHSPNLDPSSFNLGLFSYVRRST